LGAEEPKKQKTIWSDRDFSGEGKVKCTVRGMGVIEGKSQKGSLNSDIERKERSNLKDLRSVCHSPKTFLT